MKTDFSGSFEGEKNLVQLLTKYVTFAYNNTNFLRILVFISKYTVKFMDLGPYGLV
jgi:hypothetical protein